MTALAEQADPEPAGHLPPELVATAKAVALNGLDRCGRPLADRELDADGNLADPLRPGDADDALTLLDMLGLLTPGGRALTAPRGTLTDPGNLGSGEGKPPVGDTAPLPNLNRMSGDRDDPRLPMRDRSLVPPGLRNYTPTAEPAAPRALTAVPTPTPDPGRSTSATSRRGQPIEHGTYRGYRAHLRRKVLPVCPACLVAHREEERRKAAARLSVKPIAHGTNRGYRQHWMWHQWPPCEPCKVARLAYQRERRKQVAEQVDLPMVADDLTIIERRS